MVLSPFLFSYDDKVACQMILDKKGLKGYQVIQVFMFNFSSLTMLLLWLFDLILLPFQDIICVFFVPVYNNYSLQCELADRQSKGFPQSRSDG